MASARDILTNARTTMMRFPALWLPPIGINAFQSMASMPMTTAAAQVVVGVTGYLATFIVSAGWLSMIDKALVGDRPRFDDFKAGVNAHWGSLVVGNVVFFLVLGVIFAVLAYMGEAQYGMQPLQTWYEGLQKLKPTELQGALEPSQLPPAVRGWLGLFTIGLFISAIATFLLLFWQPLVVLAGRSWWRSWGESVKLVFSRFRLAFGLALLHGALFFAGLSIAASGQAVLAIVGLTALLFVSIFFKIAYAAVVRDVHPLPEGSEAQSAE